MVDTRHLALYLQTSGYAIRLLHFEVID